MSKRRGAVVGDLLAALDQICPLELAAEWDNVGLIAGDARRGLSRVVLAIDLSDAVAAEALQARANALVLYHPPIFKGVLRISSETPGPTALLAELLAARVALFSVHTALDAAPDGTNDVLLDFFDVRERFPLEQSLERGGERCKLVVFAPAAEIAGLRSALSAAGAGVIGHYSECGFTLNGRGSFRGDETTNPTIGRRGALEELDEARLEMVVARRDLGRVVRALYATHSYEEPAFDIYPLETVAGRGEAGLGRVGRLRTPLAGSALLKRLERGVDLSAATVVGDLGRHFESVTAAAGSFGVRAFHDPESLVLTGEMKHHDALELQRRGITAVCLGHYASERPVLNMLGRRLGAALPGVEFRVSRADRAPLRALRAASGRKQMTSV